MSTLINTNLKNYKTNQKKVFPMCTHSIDVPDIMNNNGLAPRRRRGRLLLLIKDDNL